MIKAILMIVYVMFVLFLTGCHGFGHVRVDPYPYYHPAPVITYPPEYYSHPNWYWRHHGHGRRHGRYH